jgi:hypothetical protein
MRYSDLMQRHCWCISGCKIRNGSLFDHRGSSKFIRSFHYNVTGDTNTPWQGKTIRTNNAIQSRKIKHRGTTWQPQNLTFFSHLTSLVSTLDLYLSNFLQVFVKSW